MLLAEGREEKKTDRGGKKGWAESANRGEKEEDREKVHTYLRIREEKHACNQRAHDHRILPSQPRPAAHPPGQHRPPDAAEIDERVVPPRHIRAVLPELGAPRREVLRQEHVVQRIRKPDQRPAEPDQPCADPDPPRREKALQMHENLAQPPERPTLPAAGSGDGAARTQIFERERAGAVVFGSQESQGLQALFVAALCDEELRGFLEAHDGDAQEGHEEDERAGGEPDVPPALVVGVDAGGSRGVDGRVFAGEIGDEGPGEEAGDELADACRKQNVSF